MLLKNLQEILQSEKMLIAIACLPKKKQNPLTAHAIFSYDSNFRFSAHKTWIRLKKCAKILKFEIRKFLLVNNKINYEEVYLQLLL